MGIIKNQYNKFKLKMDKKEAIKRLDSLESEAKKLREIIEAPEVRKPITERVKTFSDACVINGTSVDGLFNGSDTRDEIAYKKLKQIARALNEGWVPDWNNSSEYKYYPWFDVRSGFGFSSTLSVHWLTNTDTGSRLCFKTRELAEYAGKQFNAIYKDLICL